MPTSSRKVRGFSCFRVDVGIDLYIFLFILLVAYCIATDPFFILLCKKNTFSKVIIDERLYFCYGSIMREVEPCC